MDAWIHTINSHGYPYYVGNHPFLVAGRYRRYNLNNHRSRYDINIIPYNASQRITLAYDNIWLSIPFEWRTILDKLVEIKKIDNY